MARLILVCSRSRAIAKGCSGREAVGKHRDELRQSTGRTEMMTWTTMALEATAKRWRKFLKFFHLCPRSATALRPWVQESL